MPPQSFDKRPAIFGHEQRHSAVIAETLEDARNDGPRARIEPAVRIIEKHEFGLDCQGRRDAHPLSNAERKVGWERVVVGRLDTELGEGSTSALLDFGAVQSEQICVVPQGQRYVREGAQIREQAPSSKTNPRRTPCLMSSLGVLAFGSWPSRRTEPVVAGTRPAHRYSSVDFPTPLSPVTMSELPRGHVKRGLAPWSPIQPGECASSRRGS